MKPDSCGLYHRLYSFTVGPTTTGRARGLLNMHPTMSNPSTLRRPAVLSAVRVGLTASLVGLLLPTLLGLLCDLLIPGDSGSWVPIPWFNLGFVFGLYVAPMAGMGHCASWDCALSGGDDGSGGKTT